MVLPHTKSPTLNTFHRSLQIFVYHYMLNIIHLLLLLLDALHFSFDTLKCTFLSHHEVVTVVHNFLNLLESVKLFNQPSLPKSLHCT